MTQELPERLYHYCSLQGLRGIIEKKHLRMTNLFWMDDTTELFWLYEVITRVLDRRPPDEQNALHERFREMMKDRSVSNVFCACFSEDPDSRSQWLEYADNGHGFAIGFDPTTFVLKRPGPTRKVVLEPAIYDEEEQEQIADEIIRHLQQHGNELADRFMLEALYHNVWWRGARCKNPVFKGEEEWRLIYRDDPGDDLEFREKDGRQLIPFTKFRFDPDKDPVREIRLGPRNQSERNVDALAQLLRVCGYDADRVRFVGSNVPLRREY